MTVPGGSTTEAAPARLAAPGLPLSVTPVVDGLSIPWDIAFAWDGTMFFTERPGRIGVRLVDGTRRQLSADMADLWASGETGLMGIELDPDFATNRRLYTCQGTTDANFTVQVIAWTSNPQLTALTRANDPLVGGIDGSSGRHGGCQLRVDGGGRLLVGTGDAATGTNPQNRSSLAGKTLRVDRFTGAGVPGNPFFSGGGDPRILTYGHRNVQGLAIRPGGQVFSVEHGSDRDDEINILRPGGNYGWDPVPGYNEARPMTDFAKFPDAVGAVWSSGFPTIATSGAAFLTGRQWRGWEGALAVPALKNAQLWLFFLDVQGNVVDQHIPTELNGTWGRLRAAELGPDGSLYLTTSNGSGDRILRVSPPALDSTVHLRPSASPGPPTSSFPYGIAAYQHLLCDFDGDGVDGIVAFDGGAWYIRSTATAGPPTTAFAYGAPGYIPVCADWNGDGADGIGVYDRGRWHLRQTATPGPPEVSFDYGIHGYTPVVGDWDGGGGDGIGVYVAGNWYLRQTPSPGFPQQSFAYGTAGYEPVVGDWNGDGVDGTGVYVGGSWFLRQVRLGRRSPARVRVRHRRLPPARRRCRRRRARRERCGRAVADPF